MERPQSLSVALVVLALLVVGLTGCGSSRPAPPDPAPTDPPQPVQWPPSRAAGDTANVAFRIQWDGAYVAGDIVVHGLVRSANTVTSRSGGDPNAVSASPSMTNYEAITLLRKPGIDDAFERWAEKVFRDGAGLGRERSLADYRKDVTIEVFDDTGRRISTYQAARCWPSEHAPAAVPEGADHTFREWLVLQCDRWERRSLDD